MHELGIARRLVREALDRAAQKGLSRIRKITVVKNPLDDTTPESLQLHLDLASKETAASRAQLEVEEVPLKARCTNCATVYGVEDMSSSFACPTCQALSFEIVEKTPLKVRDVQ